MNRILFCALAVALALFTPACALVPTAAKENIAKGVNEYCTRLTATERHILRAEVNALVAPNAVRVTCAGDPQ